MNYGVRVFYGPYAGDKAFPTLDAEKAHCDWLRANDVLTTTSWSSVRT
jgi:hypothetical protein